MEFSDNAIAALELPAGKIDHVVFDDSLPGFGVRLRAGGSRAWIIQYRANGRQRRQTLGDLRKLTLKAAKAEAKKRFAGVLLGGDPQRDKEEARARNAQRVGPLVARYLAWKPTSRPGRPIRENTMIADRRYLNNYAKPLHSRSAHDIDRRAVNALLSTVVNEHGTTAAARARESLSSFFGWMIAEGIIDNNPVIGTINPGQHLVARDRVLTGDELRAIWRACQDDDFGRILKLLMLTAARRDEIGGLCWSELDLDRGVMTIPGTRTKNHHTLQLPLPAEATTVLRSTTRKPDREFVFGGRGGAFSAWSYSTLALNGRIAESGKPIAPYRLHDIRRTVATGMAELGVQPHIIEAVLNHQGGHKAGVAGIYNRASYDAERRRALALWAGHLQEIVDGTERKIIPINSAVPQSGVL